MTKEQGHPANHGHIVLDCFDEALGEWIVIERSFVHTRRKESVRKTWSQQGSYYDIMRLLSAAMKHGNGNFMASRKVIIDDKAQHYKAGANDCWTYVEAVLKSAGLNLPWGGGGPPRIQDGMEDAARAFAKTRKARLLSTLKKADLAYLDKDEKEP